MPLALAAVQWGLKALSRLAPPAATRVAHGLFYAGLRQQRPPRERRWLEQARRHELRHDSLRLSLYEWGEGERTLLFIHGWQGRGTQGGAFLEPLLGAGWRVLALDAPGHGESEGKRTNTVQMGAVLSEASRRFGPVQAVMSHSAAALWVLYGMANNGLTAERLVLVSPPFSVDTLMEGFRAKTGISAAVCERVRQRLARDNGGRWREISGETLVGQQICPALVVHDADDGEIPYSEAERYENALSDARVMRTEGLGHYRILRDAGVVARVAAFLNE